MELTKEQKLFRTIVEKAWEDDAFKTALIKDPVHAIEALTGEHFDVPEGKTVEVCDQTNSDTIYINISPMPSLDDMELTDDQLEILAGGGDPLPVIQGVTDPPPPPPPGTTGG
ncbi:NHLP leader peptide domain protein [Kordia sp. SMS9]|uniref:NHLP leader peptide family RiPP precursor n=1 Tax=Kordia sp. SMS9 TaxID=2282170 RepID=UPI000E0CE144|nr:NHLP leader peptide family RiPP precursor [Kordia sp. SMS9]AXG69013.1 NHLP leader peptide domain protein [Kordia sp. SMS9]